MLSAHGRTGGRRYEGLELVHSVAHVPGYERVVLAPSDDLTEFVAVAAALGLEAASAVRLAIERELALGDAALLGFDRGVAAGILRAAAARARPSRPLAPQPAAEVRGLAAGRPVEAVDSARGLKAVVPQRLLPRARAAVAPRAFAAESVADMIAWEIAAVLDGRYMGEWALAVLARKRRALA